jgi:photosystem II stability/assembly factor-like uncharacterized protein
MCRYDVKRFLARLLVSMALMAGVQAQEHWRESTPPTFKDLRRVAFIDSAHGWVSGADGTILKTTDGGKMWSGQNPGSGDAIHELSMLDKQYGWALSWTQFVDTLTWFGTNILRTTNGGTTWEIKQYPKSGEFFSAIVFHDSLHGVMGGEFGSLVHSTDGGITWMQARVDSSPYAQWGIRRIRFFNRNYGFAMGGHMDIVGVVWKTTDGGLNWSSSGVSPEPVCDMHFVDSLHIVALAGDLDFGASSVITRDGGLIWEYRFLEIFGQPSALAFRTPAEGWAPMGFSGYFIMTQDTGNTWTIVHLPPPRTMNDAIFTDSLTGYTVGDSGMVLRYVQKTVGVEENQNTPASTVDLKQNYPNPFNPSTTIEFSLLQNELVSFRVFNILGAEVKSLIRDVPMNSGVHRLHVDAVDLPSGVYFYKLVAGSFVGVGKMALIR